jgi:hypothetical protein
MSYSAVLKTGIRIAVSAFPLLIATSYDWLLEGSVNLTQYLLSSILGVGIVILYEVNALTLNAEEGEGSLALSDLKDTTEGVSDEVGEIRESLTSIQSDVHRICLRTPQIFRTSDARRLVVEQLYQAESDYVLATDFYVGDEEKQHRYEDSDVGGDLYRNSQKAYDRFVSVTSEKDKRWVRKQLKEASNEQFNLFVIEGMPKELLIPNYVIIKKDGRYEAFVSYPGQRNEGGLGHMINTPEVAEAVNDYFEKLARRAETASDCVERWDL